MSVTSKSYGFSEGFNITSCSGCRYLKKVKTIVMTCSHPDARLYVKFGLMECPVGK